MMKFNDFFSEIMTEMTSIDDISYCYEIGIFEDGLVCESGKAIGIQNKRKPALLNTAFDEAFKEKNE